MGWNADAVYEGQPFRYVDLANDVAAREAFAKAAQAAMTLAGSVDGGLAHGSLDVAGSVAALARATLESNRSACWTVAKVREKARSAQWPPTDEVLDAERSANASAKAFLEACAGLGLGIQFDL